MIVCGACEGKVTQLTLRYDGNVQNAHIRVVQKKDSKVAFDGIVQPGSEFTFVGQLTNVAWEAHVGGFVFGLVAATALRTQLRARIDRGLQRVRRQALGFR